MAIACQIHLEFGCMLDMPKCAGVDEHLADLIKATRQAIARLVCIV